MTVVAPETEAREAILRAMESAFANEGIIWRTDKLHKSLGDAGTVVGVYPEVTAHGSPALVNEMILVVQFYGAYKREVNREETIDPAWIEERAERFRKMFKTRIEPRNPNNWYFMVERISYPEDPTANISRFEARVKARGNNTALMETG